MRDVFASFSPPRFIAPLLPQWKLLVRSSSGRSVVSSCFGADCLTSSWGRRVPFVPAVDRTNCETVCPSQPRSTAGYRRSACLKLRRALLFGGTLEKNSLRSVLWILLGKFSAPQHLHMSRGKMRESRPVGLWGH